MMVQYLTSYTSRDALIFIIWLKHNGRYFPSTVPATCIEMCFFWQGGGLRLNAFDLRQHATKTSFSPKVYTYTVSCESFHFILKCDIWAWMAESKAIYSVVWATTGGYRLIFCHLVEEHLIVPPQKSALVSWNTHLTSVPTWVRV